MPVNLLKNYCRPQNQTVSDFQTQRVSTIVFYMPELHTTSEPADQVPANQLAVLLEAVKRKDRGAFETLYDNTVKHLYSLAFRVTRHHETAEEVVSDVYLQVWRLAGQYDATRGNVMAWLTVLCRSRALDTLRRSRSATLHETDSDTSNIEATSSEPVQDMLIAVEEHSAVHNALMKLDSQQRQLLALAYFRGYSHSELAKFTGLPVGTVKTQIRRSLMVLKSVLTKSDAGLGETR